MFQNEQQEYINEGLNIDNIKFKDNQKCIDLIEKKSSQTPSIFSLLDEFNLLNKNNMKKSSKDLNKEFLDQMDSSLIANEHFESMTNAKSKNFLFAIHHFAGKVEYRIDHFLEKNKDAVSPLIESVLANSTNKILNSNFKDIISNSDDSEETQKLGGTSLAYQFKDQLSNLMKILNVSSPKYVRCIKPNGQMKPKLLESYDVCRQLRCAGVLEAIRIRKIGYPIRKPVDQFIKRYKPILALNVKKGDNSMPSKQ